MPRFHCPAPLATGAELDLPPGAARHVQVLRLQPGDGITLFHGGQGAGDPGGEFDATVVKMGRSDVRVQVHGARGFALDGVVGAHLHAHIAAAHAQHGGIELAPGAVGILAAMEQRDAVTRLQAQHLHMARGAGGQINLGPGGQGRRAMKTGHLLSLI